MDYQGRTSFALVAALLDCEPKREVVEKRAHTLYGQLKAKTRQGSGHSLDGPDTLPAAVCILFAQETSVLPQFPVYFRLSHARLSLDSLPLWMRRPIKESRAYLYEHSELH